LRQQLDEKQKTSSMKVHMHSLFCISFGKSSKIALPETGSLPSAKFFAEYNISGTQQTKFLPSAALSKTKHSAKNILPSAGHSAKSDTRQRAGSSYR